ncbi:M48 family metallopeptidase [Allorhizobium sp. BGMRC 0089]|uniref:M48 family metallopeptidase n=1 Tax=Allorhizobium sonneratiae TaxID=2934936 RepID=UPI0020340507|nr:M48 family metallopeptidase [Allorhizobium sonneratiae]MCM2294415.1 M48 family metallopeptidase [Allorhizobium sonneratiae]
MLPAFLRTPVRHLKRAKGPEERVLQIAGRAIPLTIRENSRASRITLRIEPGGRALKMTVPKGLRKSEIEQFLVRHQGWMETRLAKFSGDNRVKAGGTLLFRGVPHRIHHTGQLRGLTEAVLIDDEPVIRVSGLEEHVGRRLSAFLKKEARSDLERLVSHHTERLGKKPGSITMKDTRSRWGSCSWNGNLSFSWRIVMAPPAVIDYLAAHEVAHLKEMNHGPQFWALCENLCPGMETAKAWLKRHGSELHALDFE